MTKLSVMNQIYDSLWIEGVNSLTAGKYVIDEHINSGQDMRRGLSLILRLNSKATGNISKFIQRCKEIEPEQYYYPEQDFHVTFLSIISCNNSFDLNEIKVNDYIEKLRPVIENTCKIVIEHNGITATGSCVMVKGFSGEKINELREKVRKKITDSGLEQTIDKRYKLLTAHITIIRYAKKLSNKDLFANILQENRERYFGVSEIDKIELVTNDWYMTGRKTMKLYEFKLN